ncbi:MAG: ABC transporter ATP-binding protein [Candidatus Zixiibacteriota bacterium]
MIEISRLRKRYGRFVALHEISLSIERGKVTGIIGPNGSGKSTLMKSLLGLVKPTSGSITINGYLLNGSSDYRRFLGYVPQIARFPLDLTGRETIDVVKGLRNEKVRLESELIHLFGLESELSKRIRAMSGGTRQKLSVLLACMYDPDLLICDEPTAGLDPVANTRLKELFQSLRQKERTILITTHIMSDLDEIADNVVVLLEGRVRFAGSIRELKLAADEPRLEVAVARLLERGAA